MKTNNINALLNDIEKFSNYLNRYMTRAIGAQDALGIPGTRILNRILGYVGKVRKDVEAIEALIKGARPLMETENEIQSLKQNIAALESEKKSLSHRIDRLTLNAEHHQNKARQAQQKLSALTIAHNKRCAENISH